MEDIKDQDLTILAKRYINGELGYGEERKRRLGPLYKAVQNKAFELLKGHS